MKEDPREYMVEFLSTGKKPSLNGDSSPNEGGGKSTTRRGAVSAKPISEDEIRNFKLRVIPKDSVTNQAISSAITSCLLFQHLEGEEKTKLCDAFEPKVYVEGQDIITQGDEGNEFYYLHSGNVDVLVNNNKVSSITPGGTFGELALIYGTPRAATIRATEECKVLALDSDSYNVIVKGSMMAKRRLYEEFLAKVPILQSLDSWERLTVADALEVVTFEKDVDIITQGDQGDAFYIILEGDVDVTQHVTSEEDPNQQEIKKVGHLMRSDYFGEIALLTQQPRAATVTANTPLKCLKLDRKRFERVMGPCVEILKRNVDKYNSFIALHN